jgi:hypothetical protein
MSSRTAAPAAGDALLGRRVRRVAFFFEFLSTGNPPAERNFLLTIYNSMVHSIADLVQFFEPRPETELADPAGCSKIL